MAEPLWSDESFYRKETRKWEKPYRFEKFPQMLYKAQQNPLSGKYEVCLARDVISVDKTVVILNAEQFNSTCQLTVQNEQEYERARSGGWRDSQAEAMQFHEKLQDDIAQAAAFRAHADSKMSEKAQAEARAAEVATAEHLPEIPKKPVDPAVAQRKRDAMAKARAAKAAKKAEQQGA